MAAITVASRMQSYIKPMIRDMVFFGVTWSTADLIQQAILGEEEFDWSKARRMAVIGAFVLGPLNHLWYTRCIDKIVPGIGGASLVKKLALDFTVVSPAFMSAFFIGLSAMEKQQDLLKEWKEKMPAAYKSCLGFWLPVQAVNFRFVPAAWRTIYIGSASFLWSNIMCFIKHSRVEATTN